MRGALLVMGRELGAYFRSPLAGAMGGLFVLLAGTLNWFNVSEYLNANIQIALRFRAMNMEPQLLDLNEILLRQNLGGLAFLSLIFLPLLAMPLMAEERRSGTLELLLNSPLREGSLVLGKWAASSLFFVALLLLTMPAQWLLAAYGPLHWPSLWTGYLGIALMGGAFLALVLFLGTLTRSPVLAASGGFALLLLLWVVDGFSSPGARGFPGGFLAALSAMGHLEPFLRGVLASASVLYFAVLTALGLDLARRALGTLREGAAFSGKGHGLRIQSLLRAAALLVLGGLLVFLALRHPLRRDFSPDRRNSLSPRTETILAALTEPLEITLFLPDREPERSRVAALLGAVGAGRPEIRWEIVDPGQQPRRALAEGVEELGVVLLRQGERRESFVAGRDANGNYFLEEDRLALALLAVMRPQRARLRIAQGPDLVSLSDPNGGLALKMLLEMERYELLDWPLFESARGAVPDSTDLLILPGPRRALPGPLLQGIERYLAAGGAVLLLLDPDAQQREGTGAAGFEALLGRRGIVPRPGYAVDMSERSINMGKGFEVPVVSLYAPHPALAAFQRNPEFSCFPLARGFHLSEAHRERLLPLILSSPQSYLELDPPSENVHRDPAREREESLFLAALSDSGQGGGGPLIVVGDSDFVTSAHLDWRGNADFLLGLVAYLTDETERLAPRGLNREVSLLLMDRAQRRFYALATLLALPLLVLIPWPLLQLWRRARARLGGHP